MRVTATWIIPKKIISLEKKPAQAYGKIEDSTNEKVNSYVCLFERRHDGPFFLISFSWSNKPWTVPWEKESMLQGN